MATLLPHKITAQHNAALLTCSNGCTNVNVRLTVERLSEAIDLLAAQDGTDKSVLELMYNASRHYLQRGKGKRRLWPETIAYMKEGYGEFFDLQWSEMFKKSRAGVLTEKRSLIYLHLHTVGNYSPPEIAYFFADKHRATIIEAIETGKGRREFERGYAFKYDMLVKHMADWMP